MGDLHIFWQPRGITLDHIGDKALLEVVDGDTPKISVSIRMLSIDTPETTDSPAGIDDRFAALAGWLTEPGSPVDRGLAHHLYTRLATGRAGTLQREQGEAAKAAFQAMLDRRLARPGRSPRKLFVRVADERFDQYGRLLAYVAPDFTRAERESLSRRERATFNLDMVAQGWAATFVLFPSIPGELDLPMLHEAASTALAEGRGAWADPQAMPGYEYRMCKRLWAVLSDIREGREVSPARRYGWVRRYCADLRTGRLYRPQDYWRVAPADRLFLWPESVREAVSALNLRPA
jgi:endonuclease YncB( thermonuclease family)